MLKNIVSPYFCNAIKTDMSHVNEHDQDDYKDKEFGYNWVNSSRFLFYLQVLVFVFFVLGGCYKLYENRFSKPDVPVQSSSQYKPQYK